MQVSPKPTEKQRNFTFAKQHSCWYASPKINEASNAVLFFFLNLKHGNYLNNYSRTILHKSIAINNRVSHYLKEPISTYNSNMNCDTSQICAWNMHAFYTIYQWAFMLPKVFTELTREGGKNKKKEKSVKSENHTAIVHSIICFRYKVLLKGLL